MSYTFNIRVTKGRPEVINATGTVPDGMFQVVGHIDDHCESLQVGRYLLPSGDYRDGPLGQQKSVTSHLTMKDSR